MSNLGKSVLLFLALTLPQLSFANAGIKEGTYMGSIAQEGGDCTLLIFSKSANGYDFQFNWTTQNWSKSQTLYYSTDGMFGEQTGNTLVVESKSNLTNMAGPLTLLEIKVDPQGVPYSTTFKSGMLSAKQTCDVSFVEEK